MTAAQNTCTMCHAALPPEVLARRPITRRICDECLSHYGAQQGLPLMEFLDLLEVPVMLVDEDVEVAMANRPLMTLLGKELVRVRGQRSGDVFECMHARLPSGCGRTVHCSGCAIRRAVTETFVTGRSLYDVQAYLNRDMLTQFQQLGLRISTERVWGMVLLRVEFVGPPQQDHPSAHTS